MGNRQFFWLTFVVIVVVGCLLIIKMCRSWFGMALAPSTMIPAKWPHLFGIDVSRYQILTFIIGTVIAGFAGGIYAPP